MLQYNFLPPYRALIQLLFFYDVCTCIIRCTPQRINFNIIRTFPNKLHPFTNSKVIIAFSKKYYHILLLNNVLPPPPPLLKLHNLPEYFQESIPQNPHSNARLQYYYFYMYMYYVICITIIMFFTVFISWVSP